MNSSILHLPGVTTKAWEFTLSTAIESEYETAPHSTVRNSATNAKAIITTYSTIL